VLALGQAERDAGQLGEQVGPVASDFTKLGHGRLHVVDLAAASMAPATAAILAARIWSAVLTPGA